MVLGYAVDDCASWSGERLVFGGGKIESCMKRKGGRALGLGGVEWSVAYPSRGHLG